ncbi:bifunctional DNA primase/polymerase [Gimesia benthica]|uniref:Bifunctional DNA primase/polymerase n=1 Tax=Gimesia benthica TaxID=2608982 RepID=A0A6I6AK23_9PLAN|nr:bifunctional DNA primase/polymerase [Gimesia benthica]QGQ26837.1 bifunctional DNA primase/polymerase [Gimesia benthica]
MVNQNHMLQAALDYAAKGFPVFPLIIGGKRPAGDLAPNGCKDASTDEDQICEWWTAKPDANIGVVTDGLCVVDIDGADHAWLSDNGRLDALAGSPVSQTPRGGRHYVFRQNGEPLRNTAGRLADHVDTRADGGYIVAAPSVVDGKPYKWLPGHELDSRDELPTVPEWIIQGLQVVNEIPLTLEDEKIHKGIQHNTLFKYGCKMRRWGLSFNEINAALQVMNLQRCDEPGTESAIEDIARQLQSINLQVAGSQYGGLRVDHLIDKHATDIGQGTRVDRPDRVTDGHDPVFEAGIAGKTVEQGNAVAECAGLAGIALAKLLTATI